MPEPALRRAQDRIAARQPAEAIGVLVSALADGEGDSAAARLLARLLGRYRLEPSTAVERAIRAACAYPDFDLQNLVRPAIDCLFAHPEWRALVDAAAVERRGLVEAALRSEPLAPFDDPLLRTILTRGICYDVRLERLLLDVRAVLLRGSASDFSPPRIALAAALARQAGNNEYAWPCQPDERAAVDHAAERLAGGSADEADLLYVAMYRPPTGLANFATLRDHAWTADARALLDAVAPDADELALREAMPRLAPEPKAVSAHVRAQYEENPYPRWVAVNPPAAGERRTRLLARCPPDDRGRFSGPIDVLIAGCGTGRQAVLAGLGYGAGARLVAIDLSVSSLAYAQRMARRYGLADIAFVQGDLLDAGRLSRQFDVIEAVGVLHHLTDPLAGWRALAERLKPGGLMLIGLYSERGRQDVVAARRAIAGLGLPATPDGVRRLRRIVLDAPDDAGDWRVSVRRFTDFFSVSGCRDLLFHVEEHRFTPQEIAAALAALGLELRAVDVSPDVSAAYRERFPADPQALDLANWDRFEADNPRTFSGMIGLWCRKPSP